MGYNKIVYMFILIASVGTSKVLRKCCPKNQSLIKVSSLDANTPDKYECIDYDRHLSEYKEVSQNSDLVVNRSVIVDDGIPQECNLIAGELNVGDFSLFTDRGVCYDRLITEINNGTVTHTATSSITILKCDGLELTSQTELKIQNIRKCCARGQVYDSEYHFCRTDHEFKEEWLISELKQNTSDIFVIDNELDCLDEEYSVEIKEGVFRFTLIGSVLGIIKENGGDKHNFEWWTWCIDQDYTSRRLVARVCTENCSDFGAYCMRKCCYVGNHVSGCGNKRACERNYDDRFLFNLSSYIEPLKRESGDIGDVMGIQTIFKCHDNRTKRIILNSSLTVDWHSLDMNGSLQSYHGLTREYCLDTFECNGKIEVAAYTCIPRTVNDSKLSFTLLSTSVMLLIITLVVHCSIPEFRNLHGFNLISYISSLLLGYLGLARGHYGFIPDINVCTGMGYCIYFGFISAFMWVNVLCFDIWWKMSHIQSVQRSMNRSSWIKFIKYSLYAWGISVGLTLTTFLLDIYPLSPILDAEMGKGRCWFGATVHCVRVKSVAQRLHAGSEKDSIVRRYKNYKENLLLTGKLWVVMGGGWFIEFISVLVTQPDGSTPFIMTIMDILNHLQGLWIFIILVFKPKRIYNYIRRKLGLKISNETSNGTTLSSQARSTNISMTSVQTSISNSTVPATSPNTEKKQ
ncbi:unnamed protein product [Diatraea saccharalis]|uniref:G-protein coupled receptor Mth-like 3 n=1 Tax=Diatraea saccharalis TaxID=40085 RepID=A0A9N9QVV2_9NEOP|nr:unnamed protein product [Diatraea saccharalis]